MSENTTPITIMVAVLLTSRKHTDNNSSFPRGDGWRFLEDGVVTRVVYRRPLIELVFVKEGVCDESFEIKIAASLMRQCDYTNVSEDDKCFEIEIADVECSKVRNKYAWR